LSICRSVPAFRALLVYVVTQPPTPPTLFPYTNALPISHDPGCILVAQRLNTVQESVYGIRAISSDRPFNLSIEHSHRADAGSKRSEEHTSELQSQSNLVCRLLLEKKKLDVSRARLVGSE